MCLFFNVYCQNNRSRDGEGFDSFFQNFKKGEFHGKVSGELNLVKLSGEFMKINLNKEKALLQIEPDPNEVYDVSRKIYSCHNGKDNILIKYSTYAWANAFELKINNEIYGLSLIDGGSDLVIKELQYVYKQNEKQEILYLFFTDTVGLSLPHTCEKPIINIQPGSMLIFSIEK